jgi:GNAT superfamily N-acetyltransferase
MRYQDLEFSIRRMKRNEMDFGIQLAAKEGWNPGLHDAECFYRTHPNGFFIGLLDENQPVGCISAVSYNGTFGFIGLYIVAAEHRGKGFGTALWRRAMQRLDGHNIGLDGVVGQQANYRKSGFNLAYRNMRYQGTDLRITSRKDLVPLRQLSWERLVNYDSRFFPVRRIQFLSTWVRMPDSHGGAVVRSGRVTGYGIIRRCRDGFKVGPLFADNEQIAGAILAGLSKHVPGGEPIFLDVPEVNPAAVRLVERCGMTKVFETARMYTGALPEIDLEGMFGVTTFELG